jgi:raffinose/stachyose/melibiose transport system substrate-binding protein
MRKVLQDRRLRIGLAGAAAISLFALTACGGSGSSATTSGSTGSGAAAAGGSDPSSFTFLNITENPTVGEEMKGLAQGVCSAENKALPLVVENVPQASLDQKLLLLAGQNALPSMYAAGNAPATTKTLVQGGDVVNFQTELTKLGVIDEVEPAAISSIDSLFGGFYVLPTQLNIEGIFYNKKIFAQYGISVPQTWSQLVADAATLWFEALFSTHATTVSQQDAAPLINGSMSPSGFMSAVQAALPTS